MGYRRLTKNNLKKYRNIANMKLVELSHETGIHLTTLHAYERGSTIPSVLYAVRLVEVLNNKIKELENDGLSVKADLTFEKIWPNINKDKE